MAAGHQRWGSKSIDCEVLFSEASTPSMLDSPTFIAAAHRLKQRTDDGPGLLLVGVSHAAAGIEQQPDLAAARGGDLLDGKAPLFTAQPPGPRRPARPALLQQHA